MFYPLLREVVGSTLDSFVHVLFHKLKHQGKPPRWLIIKYFNKLNYVWVRVQPLKSLDLSQVIHLINAVEVTLHTFDGHVLAISERLRFEHL